MGEDRCDNQTNRASACDQDSIVIEVLRIILIGCHVER